MRLVLASKSSHLGAAATVLHYPQSPQNNFLWPACVDGTFLFCQVFIYFLLLLGVNFVVAYNVLSILLHCTCLNDSWSKSRSWNTLPSSVPSVTSLFVFNLRLKAHLFSLAFGWVLVTCLTFCAYVCHKYFVVDLILWRMSAFWHAVVVVVHFQWVCESPQTWMCFSCEVSVPETWAHPFSSTNQRNQPLWQSRSW